MLANIRRRLIVVMTALVAITVATNRGKAEEIEPVAKTLEELAKFDSLKELGFERLVIGERPYSKPAGLEWSCKLSTTSLGTGDPLIAELTVKNPSDRVAFLFSPPARGFLVANLQVWVKADGEDLFRSSDGWKHFFGKAPRTGIPVVLGPGETRRWLSRVDNFAGTSGGNEEAAVPSITQMHWLGEAVLRKPGKYEVVIRYVNLRSAINLNGEAERVEAVGARVFGPFSVTVTERLVTDPPWVAAVRKAWDVERPAGSDVVRANPESMVAPLAKLSLGERQIVGQFGDDVTLWLLAREWRTQVRLKKEPLQGYLAALDKAVSHLSANHPNREAAEFMGLAARLDRGMGNDILRQSFMSLNPDVQILVADWLAKTTLTPIKKD